MIDLHCHLLPGVDDGPATLAESIAMARLAVADGVETIAVTPHLLAESPLGDLESRIEALRASLAAEALPLRLVVGGELALSADVPARLRDRALPSLAGGRYALVELNVRVAPPNLDRQLFDLQLAGFVPVLAHVERYRYAQTDLARLAAWTEHGAILQVTADSLRGGFGRAAQRAAEHVVRAALPAIVASDAHDVDQRRPELAFARQITLRLAGPERAAELFELGPAAILADAAFPAPAGPTAPHRPGHPWTATLRRALRRLAGS